VFVGAIPLIVMLVFNILTHLKLTRNAGFTALDTSPSQTRNIIMTRLSVAVVYVYVFLDTVALILSIPMNVFTHSYLNDDSDVTLWIETFIWLLMVRSTVGKTICIVNFPICCYFCKTFRETISEFFQGKVYNRLHHLGLGRRSRPTVPDDVMVERIISPE
jgi:hypothetical protein